MDKTQPNLRLRGRRLPFDITRIVAVASLAFASTAWGGVPWAPGGGTAGAATFTADPAATWFAESDYYASQSFHAIASWRSGDSLTIGEDGVSWTLELAADASGEVSVDLQFSHALGWAKVTDAAGQELWWAQPKAELHTLTGASGAARCRIQLFRADTELEYNDNPNGVEYHDGATADMAFATVGDSVKAITADEAAADAPASAGESGLRYSGSGLAPRPWDRVRFTLAPPTAGGVLPAGTRVRLAIDGGLLTPIDPGSLRTEYFVSPVGNDANPGTEAAPFASPARALAAARATRLAAPDLDRPLTIWLSGGRYPMLGGLLLTAADSGSEASPLQFKALPSAAPVLCGGRTLDPAAFTPISDPTQRARLIDPAARDTALELPLPAGFDPGALSRHGWLFKYEWGLRQMPEPVLVIAGRTMQLARWPNAGSPDLKVGQIVDPGPDRHDPDFWERGGTFACAALASRSNLWLDKDKVWLSGIFGEAWAWSYNKVAAFDPAAGLVTLAHAEVDTIHTNPWTRSFFHAENVFEELDAPGEYFIDRARRKLYLVPPAGFTGAEAFLTELAAPMVAARSTSHLRFEGIAFRGGRTHGLLFEDCENVTVHRCSVRAFSDDAISFLRGRGCRATACTVGEIGSSGIVLDGGDPATLTPGRNMAVNCTVERNGRWDRAWRPAVSLTGVGNEVRHCLLRDIPHMAVDVHGNDHRIDYNEITGAVQLLDDMCAIYFNTGEDITQHGTLIRRNHIHDIALAASHSRGAIYLDNMTSGVDILENVFERIGTDTRHWTVMNHGGAYNRLEANTFIDCPTPLYTGFPLTTYFSEHADAYLARWQAQFDATNGFTDPVFGARYPELRTFFAGDPKLPDSNTFRNNTILYPNIHPTGAAGVTIGDEADPTLVATSGNISDPLTGAPPDITPYAGRLPTADSITPRDWALDHLSDTPDWGADPDRDGLPNSLEFALGTDPATPEHDRARWVESKVVDGHLELRASLSPHASLRQCIPVVSPDLGAWSAAGEAFTELDTGDPAEVAFRGTLPYGTADREFYRLRLRLLE